MGVDGLDPTFGASAYSDAEAQTNTDLAMAAAQRVVVADSSKFGVKAFARICAINQIDALVTDPGIDRGAAKKLADFGVSVVIAN